LPFVGVNNTQDPGSNRDGPTGYESAFKGAAATSPKLMTARPAIPVRLFGSQRITKT
jgi:hypothetical protein